MRYRNFLIKNVVVHEKELVTVVTVGEMVQL